ncbi:ABC-type transport auxiliary lipoprotein family protein [Hyphococcus flavus]|uniref:ABC-type transport auxiliary lipoprotein family protein n=1 Tax=Hyphococcus flavus TaxID=1866326 RepID=A0AAF0CG74_9PROT|nr:ABC-type transport auxiliary lipoprotein family protein [Hyphococcus flavus]WDI32039.1 ABC-type transport auxiliary lipoprotein family protein [Hyphococcus flavus]
MMNRLVRIFACAAPLFAIGCVSVLPEAAPPKPRFHIEAANTEALSGAPLNWSLVIDDPRATRVYDTVRIAVAPAPGRIEYLGGAEWADRAPRLFQTALTQTFEDAGRIISVGDRLALPVADIVLQTDIRRMELDVSNGKNAVVEVYARLTDGKGTVYAARKFEGRGNAGSTNPNAVYDGFEAAFGEILTSIVEWSYAEGVAARGATG